MNDLLLFAVRILPIISLSLILYVLFSKQFKTDGRLIAAILHCKIVTCVFLIWADWGSVIYQPSRQIIVARGFTTISIMLLLLYAGQQQKQTRRQECLERENAELKRILQDKI